MSQKEDTSGVYVKFVPYNEKTLAGLINKTVKFSTVYEFNDFNELRFSTGITGNCIDQAVLSRKFDKKDLFRFFKQKFGDTAICFQILKGARESIYKTEWVGTLEKKIPEYVNDPDSIPENGNEWQFILENLAYSSVGIFSVSHIDVFKDDSASLMFAHYAQNLSGLALVYHVEAPHKIIYESEGLRGGGGIVDRILNEIIGWGEGDFSDINEGLQSFIKKSKKWEYENEYRLFSKPGLQRAENQGIRLKAILYTPRFQEADVDVLKNINDKFYEGSIEIKPIHSNISPGKGFNITNEKQKVSEWLKAL